MTLEEQLEVIPENEWIHLICGEKKFLGYKHQLLRNNLYLDKKVKTIQIGWSDDSKGLIGDVLRIKVEE